MRAIAIILITIFSISMGTQAQSFVREFDTRTEKPLLRGQITFNDITNESAYSWMQEAYESNPRIVAELKKLLPKYRMVVFIGTWCEDTQYLLPQFYQTLKDASFDFNGLEMYGVNRVKEGLNSEHQIYNIQKVPTIIIMDRFKEVGRIVESTETSIEQALLDLLENY